MDQVSFLISTTNAMTSLAMIAIALWIFIPRGFHFFAKWKSSKKPTYFSGAVLCFFLAFSFISFVCIELIIQTLKIAKCFSLWPERLLFFIFVYCVVIVLLIPKTLSFFQKWRATRRISDFIWLSILASILTFVMLTTYFIFLQVIL